MFCLFVGLFVCSFFARLFVSSQRGCKEGKLQPLIAACRGSRRSHQSHADGGWQGRRTHVPGTSSHRVAWVPPTAPAVSPGHAEASGKPPPSAGGFMQGPRELKWLELRLSPGGANVAGSQHLLCLPSQWLTQNLSPSQDPLSPVSPEVY